MMKRLLCLALALLLPLCALAEGTQSYRFDLRFQLDPDATGWTSRNIREGLSELLAMLRLEGTFSRNGESFDLPFEITLEDNEDTRTAFRIWGVPSHYALTSGLLGDAVLMINNLATLEFALKAYNFTEMPLPRVALLESPYVHTSAFEWAAERFNQVFFAESGSRVIPYEEIVSFAEYVADEGAYDRAFSCWLKSVCLKAGCDSDIEDAMSNAVEWVEKYVKPTGIAVTVEDGVETWKSGTRTFFTGNSSGWTLTLPPSLEHRCSVTVTCAKEGSAVHLSLKAAAARENMWVADAILDRPDERHFSFSYTDDYSVAEMQSAFRISCGLEGDAVRLVLCNAGDQPVLTVTGTFAEVAPAAEIHYTARDINEIPGAVNVLSVNDVSLTELVGTVKKPLLKGALPLLVHAPARSYAALFEFMETYSILDMISAGFSQ